MTNKSLAYDYLSVFLFNDANVDQLLKEEKQLDENDSAELKRVLAVLKEMSENARSYVHIANEENAKTMREVNTITLNNMRNTYDTIVSIKTSLQDVIKDAKTAYRYVLWMYILAFLIGLGLIITAVVFAVQGKTILSIAFGAIGLIDLVTYFIFKPPLEIQNSRSNLAQLMVILTNWFADLMNLNTYIKPGVTTLEELERISEKQNSNTARMIELMEKYGESRPGSKADG